MDCGLEIPDFCRAIETYLCKKNDGHLIRVVGPSFELVSGWAAQGVPLKVACAGIDRYFERYYRSGPRRRPVKIDFCEADVLDVFDEWRRATGVTGVGVDEPADRSSGASRPSLREHLQRAVTRLTAARASGAIGADFDAIIDQASEALDAARAKAGGVRGEARRHLIEQLAGLDQAMMALARARMDPAMLRNLEDEAAGELAPFKAAMAVDAYVHAHRLAIDHLVRARMNLPTIGFEQP